MSLNKTPQAQGKPKSSWKHVYKLLEIVAQYFISHKFPKHQTSVYLGISLLFSEEALCSCNFFNVLRQRIRCCQESCHSRFQTLPGTNFCPYFSISLSYALFCFRIRKFWTLWWGNRLISNTHNLACKLNVISDHDFLVWDA